MSPYVGFTQTAHERKEPKSEKWVKAECRKIFAEFGNANPYMPAPAIKYGKAGGADFIECMFGKYIAVETKRLGSRQTKLQALFQQGIEERGGTYLVIYETNLEDLRNTLAEWVC